MGYFYENKNERTASWEEAGGFNVHLLTALRNALLDVRSDAAPGSSLPVAVAEWIRRHPANEFPDDEIG